MNAIEIRGLKKSFRGLYAIDGLNMTVPQGAIMVLSAKTAAANRRPKSSSAGCCRSAAAV